MIGIINAAERYVGGKNKYSMIVLASERAKATKSKTMLYQRKTSRKIQEFPHTLQFNVLFTVKAQVPLL